jgi:adenine phosphoribosyltransferase
MKVLSAIALFFVVISANLFSEVTNESGEHFWICDYVTRVPDFPKKDINFLCYPNLLQNPKAFKSVIQTLAERYKEDEITAVVGLEARGFLFGVALAYEMDLPFVMIRKKGKLPRETLGMKYNLEYGVAEFEIEKESLDAQDHVLIIDDLLATGGTAQAAVKLVEELGASVHEVACIFEMGYLDGRNKVPADVFTMLKLDN